MIPLQFVTSIERQPALKTGKAGDEKFGENCRFSINMQSEDSSRLWELAAGVCVCDLDSVQWVLYSLVAEMFAGRALFAHSNDYSRANLVNQTGFEVVHGNKAIQVRPIGVTKGYAAQHCISELQARTGQSMFMQITFSIVIITLSCCLVGALLQAWISFYASATSCFETRIYSHRCSTPRTLIRPLWWLENRLTASRRVRRPPLARLRPRPTATPPPPSVFPLYPQWAVLSRCVFNLFVL